MNQEYYIMNKSQPVYDSALAVSIYANGGTPRHSLNGGLVVIILQEGKEPVEGMPAPTPHQAAVEIMQTKQWQIEAP